MNVKSLPWLALLPTLLLSIPSWGTDGVFEINQTCALETGCFPGDAPGFPVRILRSQPGSYRLTSNLVVLDPDASGIQIYDSHVVIDLNGFSISGPVTCTGSGAGLSCGPSAAGNGIDAASQAVDHVEVRNGIVRGMPNLGVHLAYGSRVEGVEVVANADAGISVGNASSIARCVAVRNGSVGMYLGRGSILRDSLVEDNKQGGAVASSGGAKMRDNVARGNGGLGLFVSGPSVITGNLVTDNVGDGIFASLGSTTANNTVARNGGDGIVSNGQGTVTGNTVIGNTGLGLDLDRDGYGGNVLTGNNASAPGTPQVSAGVEIAPNVCEANTTCP